MHSIFVLICRNCWAKRQNARDVIEKTADFESVLDHVGMSQERDLFDPKNGGNLEKD